MRSDAGGGGGGINGTLCDVPRVLFACTLMCIGVRPDLDEAHQRRAVEREGRRRRRRERREKDKGRAEHFEGLSSDDEIAEIDRMKLASSKGESSIHTHTHTHTHTYTHTHN